MASIVGCALSQVKSRLNHFISDAQVEELCRQRQHRWRNRVLNPLTTIHLFLLQLLAGVSMAGVRHVAGMAVTAQALCKAKKRLPLTLLMDLLERLTQQLTPQGQDGSCWHGHAVALVDGMSFMTSDTPQLAGKYGRAANSRGQSRCYPLPKLLASFDLCSLCLLKIIALPFSRQERTCLTRLFSSMAAATVMLADRGLAGFAQLAMMQAAALHGLIRLPRWLVIRGRGRGAHRRIKRLGRQDLLVSWRRATLRRPTWMSKRRWLNLPQQLTLRQIAFRIVRPGHRSKWAWIITTLCDPQRYPAQELVELYAKRWQVEVQFRDLKTRLGLKKLSAKTVAGVRKELLMFVLLYNLVRQVMLQEAQRQQVSCDRISFIDTLRWMLFAAPQEAPPPLLVNPLRRHRPTQPRKLKSARKRYGQLTQPRQSLIKPASEAKL